MAELITQVRDPAMLLAEFQVITAKHGLGGEVLPLLSDLVSAVPKDAFSRSYLPDNVVLMIGEVDEELIVDTVKDIWDVHKDIAPGEPIKIIMSTCGGQVYSGLALIGTINELRRLGREVHIHVLGWALSMGFDILQSASHRSMEPTSYLMMHEEQYGYEGSTSDQEQETKFSRGQEQLMLERLSERTGRPTKFYKDKIAHKNWYIGPKEALAEGLIDEVVSVPPFTLTPAQTVVPAKRSRKVTPAKSAESKTQEGTQHAVTQATEEGLVQEG